MLLLAAALTVQLSTILYGQMGTNDPTFNVADNGLYGNARGTDQDGQIYALAKQSDGKILVGSTNIGSFNGYQTNFVTRLNSDGSIDNSFLCNAYFQAIYSTIAHITSIAIQSNGKIIIGGQFVIMHNGANYPNLIRLHTDGSLDESFLPSTPFQIGLEYGVSSLLVDQDDNIYVGGTFVSYDGLSTKNIMKLNSNGAVITTFDTGSTINGTVTTMVLQNNKLVVGGAFYINNSVAKCIIRFNLDGTVDNTFNIGTGFNDRVNKIVIDGDKLIVGGQFYMYNNQNANYICRLLNDGTIDNTFTIGTGFNDNVYTVERLSSGNFLVGGRFTWYNGETANQIVMLSGTGSRITTFNSTHSYNHNGVYNYTPGVFHTVELTNDRIAVGGWFNNHNYTYCGHFALIDHTGTYVLNNSTTGASKAPEKIKVDENDDLYVFTQSSSKFHNNTVYGMYKLSTDGEFIRTLASPMGNNNYISDLAKTSDNKHIVLGNITILNGTYLSHIALLNENFEVDHSINFGVGFDNTTTTIHKTNDNKYLIGGWFTTYKGQAARRIIQLNADGTIDNTFNSGTGFNSMQVNEIHPLEDNRYLIRGGFQSYNGQNAYKSVIINSDGSFYSNYNHLTSFNTEYLKYYIYPDGSCIVGSSFITSYQNQPCNKLLKLTASGQIDTQFNFSNPFNFNLDIRDILVLEDGSILIAYKESFNGPNAMSRVMKLNPDGSLASDYDQTRTFNGEIQKVAIQSTGKIIAYGDFVQFDNAPRLNIARINNCYPSAPSEIISVQDYTLVCDIAGAYTYQWYDCATEQPISGATNQSFTPTTSGSYYVVVSDQCNLTSLCQTVTLPTNDLQNLNELQLTVYPNPTDGKINIQFNEVQTNVEISVIDIQGRIVYTHSSSSEKELQLSLKEAPGIYLIHIETEHIKTNRRIVLQ